MSPSRTRHKIIVYAVTLSILGYIDRVAISKASPYIMRDLQFDERVMGGIFSAFALGYALFEIPSGWLGDWMGPRKVLMRIVVWWSLFTAFTGMMWNSMSMWITRFLFGAGEAGCFPNLTKSFTTWLLPQERVQAQGIMWMSARWGGAFTPLLVAYLFKFAEWRTMFILLAIPGFIWAFMFYRWFRDNPQEHPDVNEAERELLKVNASVTGSHGDVPWKKLVTSPTVVLLWLQYFLLTYAWYFYITWLSPYLRNYHGVTDDIQSGWLAIAPLFFGGVGCAVSGYLLPPLTRVVNSTRKARRIMATTGFLGAAVFMALTAHTRDPLWAMLAMGMASFCNDLSMPCSWGACMEVGGKYAGTLSGSMNMMGNMAGFVAPTVGGFILSQTHNNYPLFLNTMAVAYLLGAFCWPFIDPVTPLGEKAKEA